MDDALKETLEIVKAQASVRTMSEEEMTSMILNVANKLKDFTKEESGQQQNKAQEPAVDPKKSIREKSVICLECGKSFKVLTKRHLKIHDLTPEKYKEKWGYNKHTALVARSLAKQRRKKMQEMELWKKRKKY